MPRHVRKRPALHPDQPRADQRDQRIADDLDQALGVAHRRRRSRRAAPPRCRRSPPRRPPAASPRRTTARRRAARSHRWRPVGRDHRLAVAGPGGMEDPVQERDAEQRPDRAAVGLGGADRAATSRGRIRPAWRRSSRRCRPAAARRGRRARAAERICLRERVEQRRAQAGATAISASDAEMRRLAPTATVASRAFHRDLAGELRAE